MRRDSARNEPDIVEVDWGVWLRSRGWVQSEEGYTWFHPEHIGWMPRTVAVQEQMMCERHGAILQPESAADYSAPSRPRKRKHEVAQSIA